SYNPDADQGGFANDGKYRVYGYYSVETDGSLKQITDGSFANYPESAPNHWLSRYLLTYKPDASPGDVGISVFDGLSERLKTVGFRGGIIWYLPCATVANMV
ncbi:MAG: hypothetical protein IJY15_14065, partial [Thermoguttaceae bacterium]|nr:hypothetical protein [Thermoguttaceae bacterium]